MRLSLARQLHSKLSSAGRTAISTASRAYTTHSQLPSEHQMVYEMCRKFADEELAPNAGKWDKEHSFPREAIDKLVRCCYVSLL
jgi:alkylation response protein AidB-like acyl-CoA dehydrogenase